MLLDRRPERALLWVWQQWWAPGAGAGVAGWGMAGWGVAAA